MTESFTYTRANGDVIAAHRMETGQWSCTLRDGLGALCLSAVLNAYAPGEALQYLVDHVGTDMGAESNISVEVVQYDGRIWPGEAAND